MILIIADIHLNALARDEYRHTWMRETLPALLRKYKAERLVILGDLSDEKNNLSSWLVNQTADHLYAVAQICPVDVLMGNHDYEESDNPFYEFIGKVPNIRWIGKPLKERWSKRNVLFLPHTRNYKRDWVMFPELTELFLTHQTFQGAQVGPRKLDGIPTDIFPEDALVISGDVHVPQHFGPIFYVGAPYTCNFGDTFEPRVLLLDPQTFKLKSIPSPGPQKRLVEFIYPNRRVEKLVGPGLIKCNANEGDILKVRVTIEPAQAPRWPAIREEVQAWGRSLGYTIYLVQPKVDSSETKSMAKRKVGSKSDEQLMQTYAGARAVSEATLKTGMNLMEKV